MKVLLVDDHALFREGLALLMAQHWQDVEVLQAERLAQAIAMVRQHVDLDVVLLDLALPDSQGLDALPRMHEAAPDARIVVLSADDSVATVRGAIDQGAAGFIPKTAQGSTLRAALDVVLGGGVYLPGGPPLHPSATPERTLDLTPRQLEVLHLLIRGATNKHICRELAMAESTVKTHLAVIFRRLEVSNRTQAVFAAARLGLRQARA
ncbi:response regulator transcription factor [Ramlibacter sp. G-1-2-2]|uniref:Response regulator transcription factor n=1 Tax=Ramlibacter agri TaxID=2728837 RepID=A0A848GW15_9BURK|nr:response regulator transcription factor [Ramlibacter agri]NML42805.1 response regulator transcription factor [Ramlibacter agri]